MIGKNPSLARKIQILKAVESSKCLNEKNLNSFSINLPARLELPNLFDLILDTFEKIIVPTSFGNSSNSLQSQIHLHIVRTLLSHNIQQILNSLTSHNHSDFSLTNILQLVFYVFKLSGITI